MTDLIGLTPGEYDAAKSTLVSSLGNMGYSFSLECARLVVDAVVDAVNRHRDTVNRLVAEVEK